MDRLESMAVFVKAVDLGSFAAAAVALDVSGPMVGKHVRFLEERLGVRLLNRTTRRQSLTDFGRAYYERCRVVLAEADAADALAADQFSEPRGKLRVTMPAHFGRHCVTPVLLKLARQYPMLELDLSLSDRFADLAEDGYDLAIRTGALGDKAGVIARRVARQDMVVCAAPSYLRIHGEPRQIEDLADHQAIVYRRLGQIIQPWLFAREGQPVQEIIPTGRLRLDDLDAIADAAADGMGLAWLPWWLVRERIEAGVLLALLPDQPRYLYDCHALWLQTPHLPLKVRLAVDALAAALPKSMA
ncbi:MULTISPECIES: LysR family transcriptional regulator [unclassified Mesorhizobium]|uniref:LysR family transcriptional regulator n=1 Tax=unclassified Mesorhizobium TaxID=325217 RepID=UPI000FCC4C82|nr:MULTISPECIES: LysR family transcriptional regulator [unclassified Mesorhizobium]RUU72353.1 LysR family transcriptional regulator [Mesorhizobium sp. M7A.T.Ca.TU.009.01.1.2]RWO43831.1 MAG: LysR family transcriptional regulator [Mesorhizobium sp.]RUT89625.1 LysR family transcriptional regulator [Mesorhizobium sp. M7A.T.Ca.US.000.02.1.1]RUT91232.1 LysR family transcriptional regulator [Mesorhizobium sp. M7A.T.Ca.US.000.02.2.1]RUU03837.1 LysR family transcriptional regulator [Mesorhizobium sp. M